jgi:sugar lactone lactonase YvrE
LQHAYAFDAAAGQVWIADRSNRVLRRFDPESAAVVTEVGKTYAGGASQHADGNGTEARFSGVGGLAQRGRTLFVADTFNHVVRAVDLDTLDTTTVAGAPGEAGQVDGDAESARFDTPQGIAASDSHLYTVGFDAVVRRIALDSFSVERFVGDPDEVVPRDGNAEQARFGVMFASPVLWAGGNALVVFDRDANSVRSIDLADRSVRTIAGPSNPFDYAEGQAGSARFASPLAVAAAPEGEVVWVADTFHHCIREVSTTSGATRTVAGLCTQEGFADGNSEESRFSLPAGLVYDATQNVLYISDAGNHAIRRAALDTGEVTTLVGGAPGAADGPMADARLTDPWHLALLPGEALFVADYGNRIVRRIDLLSGVVSTVAGGVKQPGSQDGGADLARFRAPTGLALNASRRILYVSDIEAHTVRAIALATGVVSTLAGADLEEGVANGVGAAARFSGPSGLALEPGGKGLLVADGGNHCLRRIDLEQGQTSTWLGSPSRPGNIGAGAAVVASEASVYAPAALALLPQGWVVLAESALFVLTGLAP